MTQTDKITHAIVVNEIAKNANMWLRNTPYFKGILKNRLNQLLPELYKAQKDYDSFFNKVEESTEVVYKVYEDYTKAISSVPIWECENITKIINSNHTFPYKLNIYLNKFFYFACLQVPYFS